MRKTVKIFDNGSVWETTGNLNVSIPNIPSEEIDVTDETEAEIKKIKTQKIDKKPK